MTLYHIDFEPVGRRGECSNEQSLVESSRQLSVDLVSICGGDGQLRALQGPNRIGLGFRYYRR